ncbi:MAG: hypothetical protein WBK45_02610 [Tepidanaerobacteraceae bacterium]|jgi:uncharacterized membrane protein
MKGIKLYNVIFPIWLLLFFPPVILVTIVGNFIIDSLVICICYFAFKLSDNLALKTFYTGSIYKVWVFGFMSDLIGAAILFTTGILGDSLGIPYEIYSAINFDPFSNPVALAIIVFAMAVSALLIFLLNYKITFKKMIADRHKRLKLALSIAILTLPWTFLLPTKWFYRGF